MCVTSRPNIFASVVSKKAASKYSRSRGTRQSGVEQLGGNVTGIPFLLASFKYGCTLRQWTVFRHDGQVAVHCLLYAGLAHFAIGQRVHFRPLTRSERPTPRMLYCDADSRADSEAAA